MKVTALIPDRLMEDVKSLCVGKNTTESLIIVLKEWVSTKRLQALNREVRKHPLKFRKDARTVRITNRRV